MCQPGDAYVQGFNFTDFKGIATSVGLIAMPFTWGFKAKAALQEKADDYKAAMHEMLLHQQKSSNESMFTAA